MANLGPTTIYGDLSVSGSLIAEGTTVATQGWVTDNFNDYVHPATHPPSIIVQDSNNRFVTDAQIASWNAGINFTPENTGYNNQVLTQNRNGSYKWDNLYPKSNRSSASKYKNFHTFLYSLKYHVMGKGHNLITDFVGEDTLLACIEANSGNKDYYIHKSKGLDNYLWDTDAPYPYSLNAAREEYVTDFLHIGHEKYLACTYCGDGIGSGRIIRFDGSTTPSTVHTSSTCVVWCAEMVAGNILAGSGNYIVKSTDNGLNFTNHIAYSTLDLNVVIDIKYLGRSEEDDGFVVLVAGTMNDAIGYIYKSKDNGETFYKVKESSSDKRYFNLVDCGNGIVLALSAGTTGSGVIISYDFGETWNNSNILLPSSHDTIYKTAVYLGDGKVALSTGRYSPIGDSLILLSEDYGKNFYQVGSNLPNSVRVVSMFLYGNKGLGIVYFDINTPDNAVYFCDLV